VLPCGPDNTLYLTLRAHAHAGVELYGKPQGSAWERRSRIVENAPDCRAAYATCQVQTAIEPRQAFNAPNPELPVGAHALDGDRSPSFVSLDGTLRQAARCVPRFPARGCGTAGRRR